MAYKPKPSLTEKRDHAARIMTKNQAERMRRGVFESTPEEYAVTAAAKEQRRVRQALEDRKEAQAAKDFFNL